MSRHRDDGEEIKKGLEDGLERLLDRYYPGWITNPDKSKALLTPKKKGRLLTSSFHVDLKGTHRGRWYRHSQHVGGHVLHLIFYAERDALPLSKTDWADAYGFARDFLGIAADRPQESPEEQAARERRQQKERQDRERKQAEEAKSKARYDAWRSGTGAEIFGQCPPLAGSQGEAYLVGRDIPPVSEWPWSPVNDIRFCPSLDYELGGVNYGRHPAVVMAVRDPFGEITAIWKIYLDAIRPVKSDAVPEAKLGFGPASGGAVRIGGDGPRIGSIEGGESALSQWVLHGYAFPIWAMLSTSGMIGFDPPVFVERIDYFPDGDLGRFENGRVVDPPGLRAAKSGAARTSAMGLRTVINEPALYGDGNTILHAWQGAL